MRDVLFIKTSSMGDTIHHMPALMDAKRHLPDARFSWVVEEAFAPLVRLNPAVDDVIPVATRRWRKGLLRPAAWQEMRTFAQALRARHYDVVVDTQGLIRSALIAKTARGLRHGYDAHSIREPLASRLYDVRHAVSRDQHAIARNRALTALALGYDVDGDVDYGLDRTRFARAVAKPYVVMLHATAQMRKAWPQDNWIALGRVLTARGFDIVLPWGADDERARSEAIAAQVPGAQVPGRQPLDGVAGLLAGAAGVIGVDTGLLHLAAALRVPLVGIFVASEPGLTGPVGSGRIAVLGGKTATPSVADVAAAFERVATA
jgi:heptosyltransferase-1